MKKEFEMLSSDRVTVYVVSFELDAGRLFVTCNCQAGGRGKWCKHKTQLVLRNQASLEVNSRSSDMSVVAEWLIDSKILQLVNEFKVAEVELRKAKENVDRVKNSLDRIAKVGA